MNKNALVWRKSVYQNSFKCNQCGEPIANEDGEPRDDAPFSLIGNTLHCPKCLNPVARLEVMDVSEDVEGLQGDYDEFQRKQKQERKTVRVSNLPRWMRRRLRRR